jgi:hypothetical protein
LQQVDGFLLVFSTNKTDHHDIAEILLKVMKAHVKKTTGKQRINQDEQMFPTSLCSFSLMLHA